MKTKSKIKLFATAILATTTIGANAVYADAQINRDTANDSVEIISDPYKTYEEADKALNNVKDRYLAEYGSYRAGVVPTEDLKHYEVYAILHSVSRGENPEPTVQKVAKALSSSKSVESAKPVEDVKPETPAKPADEGKISNDIKEITGKFKFTEIKTTSTGLTFKAKLPEAAPHAGPILPNIQATLTEKATGKEVAKTGVVLEGLSEELKEPNALYYSNLLEGTIFEPSLTPGNYILTVEGTTGPTYGQNTDKRKRHFVFSTKVTLTGEGNATTTTQPEKPKDSTTKPKSDQTTNNVNNNQQPNNDKNKQITNNNTGKQDKNELSTNKTSDTKTGKQTSDNTLSQEKQQTTSTSTTKQEDNKNNDKKILPNTGESTSILGILGTVLSITGLGFIVKRKRG
ncbi:LPXTG cell wall anchor domain-containing protein [Streptococcus timonensis]|jgi:cell wall surface anchor signal protein|uniref:LPXTG cell wall anchor domain-containing protein n=1 Tax=Streptococcus timonensis TaxID=1852387 RepID=UPI0039C12B0F